MYRWKWIMEKMRDREAKNKNKKSKHDLKANWKAFICILCIIYNVWTFSGGKAPSGFRASISVIKRPSGPVALTAFYRADCRSCSLCRMGLLIGAGLQFIHSFPLNEEQYYYHFSMTTTWRECDSIMLPSEWPYLQTSEFQLGQMKSVCWILMVKATIF